MAGLGNPVPMGLYLTCNKARFTLLVVSGHFWTCILWNVCTTPSGHAIVVIGRCYGLLCVHLPTKSVNISDVSYANTILASLTKSSAVRLLVFLQ